MTQAGSEADRWSRTRTGWWNITAIGRSAEARLWGQELGLPPNYQPNDVTSIGARKADPPPESRSGQVKPPSAASMNGFTRQADSRESHARRGRAVPLVGMRGDSFWLPILFQVYVPRFLTYLSYLELPLLVTVYFSLMHRSPVAGVLFGSGIGLAQDSLSNLPLGMFGIVKTLVGYFAASVSQRLRGGEYAVRFFLASDVLPVPSVLLLGAGPGAAGRSVRLWIFCRRRAGDSECAWSQCRCTGCWISLR